MILTTLTLAALASVDPCAEVQPAAERDAAAAAEYRAVAEAEQEAGHSEAAAAAWRLAATSDPSDAVARRALAELCLAGRRAPSGNDPMGEAIRLLDGGRYREAAELLREERGSRPGPDAALLEGICRYELGEDVQAARLLREAEADEAHRATARLYLGLLALRGGSAVEAASLFAAAGSNPSLSALAHDLARSARWEGPVVGSVLAEGGYDSNVRLTSTQPSTGGTRSSNGDAVAGISAVLLGRPFGPNGLYFRAAGSFQDYARLDAFDFRSGELAAGARWWRGSGGAVAEYSWADRSLGGVAYLATHRLLVTATVPLGPLAVTGSWWGRFEDYAPAWERWSGFAQRAEGRVSVALGSRARLGAAWVYGRDDADDPVLSWDELGPRADLRIVLSPRARIAFEAGITARAWDRADTFTDGTTSVTLRLEERILEGATALEWDVGPRTTLRFSLAARGSDSNYDPFDYTKVLPSAAIGVLLTP